ncbi:TIGR03086 family metal-binding protein, partial [Saccharopolyspora shandongensis]|uniref:TIGR03086 family metal-binding protein n=1 Tax=Saccharopolyspora shandongensis TaxID=418495 RepID=UPI0033FA6D26
GETSTTWPCSGAAPPTSSWPCATPTLSVRTHRPWDSANRYGASAATGSATAQAQTGGDGSLQELRELAMSETRQPLLATSGTLGGMTDPFEALVDRFALSSMEFERKLRVVHADQPCWPTPCAEWNVRQLVNHVTRGNLNYLALLRGGTADEFLALRDADALGPNPLDVYATSWRECAAAFAEPGAFDRILDYPLGKITARQALALRTTDNTIHTWDLARAIGIDETINPALVAWINTHLNQIYANLPATPVSPETTNRFFAPPQGDPADNPSPQDRLLHRMGRNPDPV